MNKFATLTSTFVLFLLLGVASLSGQPMSVVNNAPFTPENLITNIFLGEGVEVIDVQFDGTNNAVGFFNDADDEIGIQRGLVMSTGNASAESGPGNVGVESVGNVQSSSPTSGNTIFDADLAAIANGINYFDAARYTITFVPISDTLRFNYVFGSEEYPEYVCSAYNDIFGFFISGPGINGPYENNGENIALIPGTDLPVRINNVNPGVVGANGTAGNCTPPNGSLDYSAFYNANTGTVNQPVFDGFTDVFTAEAVVIPCSTYTIKLVIADVSDGGWDSGVFLEAKSFGTGSLDVEATTISLDGSVAEGCGEGILSFVLPVNVESDYPIDYTIIGTAENGVDYEFIPPDLFIPAGDSIVSVPIIAFEDGLDEGVETILIDVQRDPCNRDTIIIPIRDNPLIPADLGADTVICQGDTVQFDGTLDVPLPPPLTFYNDEPVVVSPAQTAIYSDVDVFGVLPANLVPGTIESVCIEDLQTTWVDDLKIYLFSPGGEFMELVTDIGNPGDNFIGTCFTPVATTPITDVEIADQPFTGEFMPEGLWEDLYGDDNPTNGTWQLSLFDKFAADVPVLNSWSITFTPIYEITYEWFPAEGLSCTNCPDPLAFPDSTTTYYMTATDSYGCTTTDSITITVIPDLEAPQAVCSIITQNSITIAWPPVSGALSYEVNVDNMGWQPANGINTHVVNGLNLSTIVNFQIRAVGECPGAVADLQCATPDCTPPALNVDATTVVSCFGGMDGGAVLSASGGVPPYQFNLAGQSNDTGIFTGLPGGTYEAAVLDSTGCPQTIEVLIEQPDSLDATLMKEDASCYGAADGTAAFDIAGGVGPYQFMWSNGQMDSVATGLAAGMYSLDLTDAGGCSYTYMLEILQPDTLEASVVVDSVDCFGGNSGSAIVTPNGGLSPYVYTFDPGLVAGPMEGQVIELLQGSYNYTVTDANGCIAPGTFEVEEPDTLILEIMPTPALCADSTSGSASTVVTGGVGVYAYLWQDAASNLLGNGDQQDGLGAGDYTLSLTDANGCSVVQAFEITEPPAIEYTINLAEASCFGLADGSASIQPSGGTGNYSFEWSDIGPGPGERNDLATAMYGVTIYDEAGCTLPLAFEIESPDAIVLSLDSTAVSCFGGMDGTATVIPEGGAAPYSYNWENAQTGQTATGLAAGFASVTVSDVNGCQAIDSIMIEQATALELFIAPADPSCFNAENGEAIAIPSGGTSPYTYEWSNSQTTETATGLSAGGITVTVYDANNCSIEADTILEQPSALVSTVDSQTASCLPTPDGEASIDVFGGVPPYTYLWSNGQMDDVALGLPAGTYYVSVTDANDCILTDSVEVAGTPGIELSATTIDVSCNGGSDGTGTITATGGSGTYTYNWGNGLPNSASQNTLSAQVYVVTVTDEFGCEATIAVEVEEPAAISLNTDVNMIGCAGSASGSASVQPSGGTFPYTYLWSNGANTSSIENLGVGTYMLTVTDANGCISTTSVFVDESTPVVITVDADAADCYGEASGAAQLLVEGGVPPYTYQWPFGLGSDNDIENVIAGTYEVLITDAAGCEILQEVVIPQPLEPLSAEVTPIDVTCFGESDGQLIIDALGGTPSYRYSLDGDFFSGSSVFLGLEAGAYGVLVEDANGCTLLLDAVVVGEPDAIEVDLGADRSIPFGDTIQLFPAVTGGTGCMVTTGRHRILR
jgi:subtilisin-like proprotein convertase family protein